MPGVMRHAVNTLGDMYDMSVSFMHKLRWAFVPMVIGQVLIVGAELPAQALIVDQRSAKFGLRRPHREHCGHRESEPRSDYVVSHLYALPS